MERKPFLGIAIAVLVGACTAQGPSRPALTEHELLSGDDVAIAATAPTPISPTDAFGLDAQMREFVRASVGGAVDPRTKLRRLVDGMERDGLFKLDYTGIVTRSAQETFHERRGNCLSFTMLFVGLAREAGLDVVYQLVDVPPEWSSESELIVVRSHINALVTLGSDRLIVDFNLAENQDAYQRRNVDDTSVLGLFYSNVGAEALVNKDYALGFSYLREAARVAPGIVGAWVNLGAMYSRLGLPSYAEAAYLHALTIEPSQRSALSNLARLYSARGDNALAAVYLERVRHYQDANPYYHYSLARNAYDGGRFDAALGEIRRALRLKSSEHKFYLLQGRTLLELDRPDAAAAAFDRGREYAEPATTLAEYDAQVESFAGATPTLTPSAATSE